MNSPPPFDAVILELDGVLLDTASMHRESWAATFNACLAQHASRLAPANRAAASDDDWRIVRGRPRYDAARVWARARGLALPPGSPADPAGSGSVCGLANLQHRRFFDLVAQHGVAPFDDALAVLRRWRHGGLRLSTVAANGGTDQWLRAAGPGGAEAAVVDAETGNTAEGLRDLYAAAVAGQGVKPAKAVSVAASAAGVRAGRALGFGLVVGMDRTADGQELAAAGAHQVVASLRDVRFGRRVPSLRSRLDVLAENAASRPWLVSLDYDGTLTPIVDDPAAARLSDAMRTTLEQVSRRFRVAVISGRDRSDVAARVGLSNVIYAGSHGFDIAYGDRTMTLPSAEACLPSLVAARRALAERLKLIAGVFLEHKRFGVAVHYRHVDPSAVDEVRSRVEGIVSRISGIRIQPGKKVFDVQPDVEWHKGRAVQWILQALDCDADPPRVLHMGDDETDEDVFRTLGSTGVGVRVGPEVLETQADYRLAGPDEVRLVLERLAADGSGA